MNHTLSLLNYQIMSDIRSKFLGSSLGIFWCILSPLLQVFMYVFLFGFVFKIKFPQTGSGFDYVLFILSGMVGWLGFQEGILSAASSITRNGAIIKNIVFPMEIFPIASVFGGILTFLICLISYALLSTGSFFSLHLWTLPFILIVQILFMIGCGFIISTIGAFVKDMHAFLPTIMQLLLIGTPIFYELKDLPSMFQKACVFNPLYYIFDSYRLVLFYNQAPHFTGLVIVGLFSCVFSYVGLTFFKKFKGYFESVI